jgi:hypothetical protein
MSLQLDASESTHHSNIEPETMNMQTQPSEMTTCTPGGDFGFGWAMNGLESPVDPEPFPFFDAPQSDPTDPPPGKPNLMRFPRKASASSPRRAA